MEFTDLALLGGAAWLIKAGMRKSAADKEEQDRFLEEQRLREEEWERDKAEWDRCKEVNKTRKEMPCFINGGISEQVFRDIVYKVDKSFKRITKLRIEQAVIYCTVQSQTGYSEWDFTADFNDWGHVTGTYWIRTDNNDSSIPSHFGQVVSEQVEAYLSEHRINQFDFSDYVDNNHELGTNLGFDSFRKESWFEKLFISKKRFIHLSFDLSRLVNEHLYDNKKGGKTVLRSTPTGSYSLFFNNPIKTAKNDSADFYISEIYINKNLLKTTQLKYDSEIVKGMNYFSTSGTSREYLDYVLDLIYSLEFSK